MVIKTCRQCTICHLGAGVIKHTATHGISTRMPTLTSLCLSLSPKNSDSNLSYFAYFNPILSSCFVCVFIRSKFKEKKEASNKLLRRYI